MDYQLPPDGPDGAEILSECLSLACISIMAIAMGSKSKHERFDTLTYGRMLVLVLYILSWTFSAFSIVIVSTNDHNIVSCTMGILICACCYAMTKIVLYAWLIERVHLVSDFRCSRFESWQYRFHMVLLCPYVAIFILMILFRNNYILEDGTCIIGLQSISSIPLMCYDFILNLYLTFLFVRPLVKSTITQGHRNWRQTRLYKLTRRTVVASIVCLMVSLINILTLAITDGRERGLMCLSMCTADVTINVITIHWVTSRNVNMSVRHPAHGGDSTDLTQPTTMVSGGGIGNVGGSGSSRDSRDGMPPLPKTSAFDDALYGPKYNITLQNYKQDMVDDIESIRSVQISQSSGKPLQDHEDHSL